MTTSPNRKPEGTASTADWAIFAVLVAIGGSSFAMIRIAVDTIPPILVAVGRLWVGALFLYGVMRQAGRNFPPLLQTGAGFPRLSEEWRWILGVSLVGYVVPFLIFPWAQQYIESGLAGVYMAFMPIFTVLLAYVFANETLGLRKILGFVLGFVGVMVLLGPDVLSGAATSSVMAQASLLVANIGYAGAAVMTRRAPEIRPRVFAAGTLLCAAIITTPLLLFVTIDPSSWSTQSVLGVIGLGLGPTGLAGILLIILIQRVGAGFMGLANYITPVWAVILGALLFQERLEITVFIALAIILTGVAISQAKAWRRQVPTTNR